MTVHCNGAVAAVRSDHVLVANAYTASPGYGWRRLRDGTDAGIVS